MKKLIILSGLLATGIIAHHFGARANVEALNLFVGVLLGLASVFVAFYFGWALTYGYRRPQYGDYQLRELHELRRENARLRATLDARQLSQPTTAHGLQRHGLRVVGEWEE